MPVLGQMLRQKDERQRLWVGMESVLTEAQKDPVNAAQWLRRVSRMGYDAEFSADELSCALEVVAHLKLKSV